MSLPGRRRLDAELVHRRLVPSRRLAHDEIVAGRVLVDGQPVTKPARPVGPDAELRLTGDAMRFVSRAGLKLDRALERFGIDVDGLTAVDAGASTGGFTDCLLQRGVARVVAVDVGTDQLHARLRADERVTVRERTDIRALDPDTLPGPIGLVVVDLSFISLRSGHNLIERRRPQYRRTGITGVQAIGWCLQPGDELHVALAAPDG
ncbi:MAG: TlyA family RNA methyltransferase [Actinomycetota bacterium]